MYVCSVLGGLVLVCVVFGGGLVQERETWKLRKGEGTCRIVV